MIVFGLVMLVPRMGGGFATATAGLSASADIGMATTTVKTGLRWQFLGGALLGVVWSPCIGPTLGAAIALAAQGQDLIRAGGVMVAFALGVSTLIVAIAYGARSALKRRQVMLRRVAKWAKPIMGVIFILIGSVLLLRFNHLLDAWLLRVLPDWLVDFSVSI